MLNFRAGARVCAALLVSVLSAASGVAAAAVDPLQTTGPDGDLVLVADGDSARLHLPDGGELNVALPAGTVLSSLAAVDGGWVAAGSASTADGGRRLVLLGGDEHGAHRLAVPGRQQGTVRQWPVLLVDGGRLAGLAWLEGDGPRTLAVAAAAVRPGGAWRRPVWVSQPGPGSQIGLAGAVLADGSWLLAWSAFDGHDDEIVWSRRVGSSWQPAERVSADNAVPDVVPALTAAGSGALLAWDRYDGGEYRLMLARFTGDGWHDERTAGDAGTLFPAFSGQRDRPRLTYRSVHGGGWAAEELDTSGRVVRRAEAVSSRSERPVVEATSEELRLSWPEGPEPVRKAEPR